LFTYFVLLSVLITQTWPLNWVFDTYIQDLKSSSKHLTFMPREIHPCHMRITVNKCHEVLHSTNRNNRGCTNIKMDWYKDNMLQSVLLIYIGCYGMFPKLTCITH
jgi:hypothetical protein